MPIYAMRTLLAMSVLPVVYLKANTIIAVTNPPVLSTLITATKSVAVSWSQTQSYVNVRISVLVDSSFVGETPSAAAYLTTGIGPGTTIAANEVASTQFTVPALLPVCSGSSCGAMVTLFSGLALGPGAYYLTLASSATVSPVVGWFPVVSSMLPAVILDAGVVPGGSYSAELLAGAYAPASGFSGFDGPMIFEVTGTPTAEAIPEPVVGHLVGLGLLLFCVRAHFAS